MKFARALCFLLLGGAAAAWAGPRRAGGPQRVPDELLAQAQSGVQAEEIERWAAAHGARVVRRIGSRGLYHLKTMKAQDSEPLRKALGERRDLVRYAGPNLIRQAHYTPLAFPNDPYYRNNTSPADDLSPGNAFPVVLTQLDRAWNTATGGMAAMSRGSANVVISDLDTGMNVAHEEFVGRTLTGHNSMLQTSSVLDFDGHGTHVASFISVATDNGKGIAGGAIDCKLMPVKCSSSGTFYESDEIDALHWAADHGAHVINLSFGGDLSDTAEADAIAYALSKGCLITASAGNEADVGNPVEFPAAYPGVIAVGASDHTEHWETFSNWGDYVFCVAPDGGVGCKRSGTTGYDPDQEGTSFAAPAVAGLAAILISNGSTGYDCISRIARTCDKIDSGSFPYSVAKPLGAWSDHYGYGRINHYRALATLVPPALTGITGGISSIDLTWTAPPLDDSPAQPLSSYKLYRATSSGGPYSVVGTYALTATGASDTAPLPGVAEYYVLKGVNSNGLETKASNELSAAVFATPTPTFSITPTHTISPTHSPTPTVTETPTITPTPHFAASGVDHAVLGPVPVRQGQDLCLFFDQEPLRTQGQLYNSAGERVAALNTGREFNQCWSTKSLAPGIYYCDSNVEYLDGSRRRRWQKIVILP